MASALILFLLTAGLSDAVPLTRRYTTWSSGTDGKVTWAANCDWTGGDISNTPSTGENCGGICLSTPGCTRFTWTNYQGGTCWLKKGTDALVTSNGATCGSVIEGNGRFTWNSGNAGVVSWAWDCDWTGGDISSFAGKSEECGTACLNASGCVKFVWSSYQGGTCFLKSTAAGANAVVNKGAVCGVVASNPGIAWASAVSQAQALVAKLSTDEKVNLVSGIGWAKGACVGNIASKVTVGFQGLCLQDSPAGVRYTSKVSAFPSAINLAATFDKKLMSNHGLYMGQEFRGKGVNVALGPSMNPMRSPRGGRIWEAAGADPVLNAISASLQIKGMQSTGVIATAKHFLLNEQETNRHGSDSQVGIRALHEVYLRPFKASVDAGVGAVMCSYNSINSTLACENSAALSILKNKLGFQGFVMTDWWATASVAGSANAGSDMMMPGNFEGSDTLIWGAGLASQIGGAVSVARLNDMATRILAAWIKMGQNDGTFPSVNLDSFKSANDKQVDVQGSHKDHIRAVGAASSVLVKNANSALPITSSKYATIAVIGEDAAAPTKLNDCGGNNPRDHGCIDGTVAQGWGSGTTDFPYIVAPVDGIKSKAAAKNVKVVSYLKNDLGPAADAARSADLAVVFVMANSGEEYVSPVEGVLKGDRNDLNLWRNGDSLVAAVAAVKKTIVVIHSPGPVNMPWLSNPNVVGVFYALFPGQETGNAIADVLFGDVNPSGRLPFTVAASESQYPATIVTDNRPVVYSEGILVDYRYFEAKNIAPLVPFGHGLSYTTFTYANLKVTSPSQYTYTVTVDVSNTGSVAGSEVVQLYLRLPTSTCQAEGCAKELRNFERVGPLSSGQTVSVAMTLTKDDISVYSPAAAAWVVPSGQFSVLVGASSADIKISANFNI
ncbi:glycoside hydrolase superfamily [Cladochytrium replicatum]|nr:glycoside hydrolase superfamily [Cladochytrium replicatum]